MIIFRVERRGKESAPWRDVAESMSYDSMLWVFQQEILKVKRGELRLVEYNGEGMVVKEEFKP